MDEARLDPPPTGGASGPAVLADDALPQVNPVQQADDLQIETPVAVYEPAERPTPSAAAMIVFESVTKVYDPDVVALRDVSFSITNDTSRSATTSGS